MRSTLNCKMEQTVTVEKSVQTAEPYVEPQIMQMKLLLTVKLLGEVNCGQITTITMNMALSKLKKWKNSWT